MQREQQVVTEQIFWTAYKKAKLKRPFYEYETEIDVQECSKLDIGKILHSNVACVDIA
jgi:hypothetical protein